MRITVTIHLYSIHEISHPAHFYMQRLAVTFQHKQQN